MTPDALSALRMQLPYFEEAAQPSALYQEFLRFYQLDFSAEFPDAKYQYGSITSGNFQLVVHRWLQPSATRNLLLVHGYFDHTGLYGRLIEYGLSRNYNVLIFDLPGHGLSSGEPAVIDDFSAYSRAIKDVLLAASLPDLPLVALGQSTGCAALTDYARHYSWPFAHTIYLAPLVRPAGWLGVRVGHKLLHRLIGNVKRKPSVNSSDLVFLEFLHRDPLQSQRISMRWLSALKRWLAGLIIENLGVGPVLVVQGENDQTVAWRYNMTAVAKMFPQSEFFYLPTAGHQLANESVSIREEYFQRVDQYLNR